MNWTKLPGLTEYLLSTAFVLLYIAFLWRNRNIARRLKSRSRAVYTKLFLRVTYFALFIVALLGPTFGETKKEVLSVGKDIYIAVDLSRSMNAYDVQPSRLEKVKLALSQLISAFRADRIGLIIFSSDAFVQCPLTYDGNALQMFTETLNTNLVSGSGTDFAKPLRLALDKLNAKNDNAPDNQAKAVLLISDGEDFSDNTLDVAKDLEESGIKLFTLGVGTREGSPVPTPEGPLRDEEGNKIISSLNSTGMRKPAELTGGRYFEINKQVNETGMLINAVSRIEGVVREVRKIDTESNKYSYFLAVGILLMVFDIVFTVKIVRL